MFKFYLTHTYNVALYLQRYGALLTALYLQRYGFRCKIHTTFLYRKRRYKDIVRMFGVMAFYKIAQCGRFIKSAQRGHFIKSAQ